MNDDPDGYDIETDPAFDRLVLGWLEPPPIDLIGADQVCHRCKQTFRVGLGPILALHISHAFLDREYQQTTEYACDACAPEMLAEKTR